MLKVLASRFKSYAVAVLTVAIAFTFTVLLQHWLTPTLSPLFFAAVTLSAWYGGMESGLLATVLSAIALNYIFSRSTDHVALTGIGEVIRLGVFVLVTLLLNSLNTKLRTAKHRLEKSLMKQQEREQQYRELFENANDIIYTLDLAGNLTSFNKSGERITGYTREQLLNRPISQIIVPEYLEIMRQRFEQKVTGKKLTTYELEIFTPDQQRVTLEVSSRLIEQDGHPVGIQGIARNISDRKQVEANLKQLSQQVQEQANALNVILSASVDNIYIFDRHGRYQYVSTGGAAILGLSSAKMIGKTWQELGLPAEQMTVFDLQRAEAIASGQPIRREIDFQAASGLHYYEYIIAPLQNQDQSIIVISRDITERKQAEEAQEISETRFRKLVEQSPLSIQIADPNGKTLQVNRAFEELWGLTLDQLSEYNLLQDQQLVDRGIMPYLQRGFAGEAVMIPAILYDPDQSLPNSTIHQNPQRWVRAFIYPVKDEQEKIREVVLIHEDITPRILAESALRSSEAKFRRLEESNIIGMITVDISGSLREANEAFLQMVGYTREDLVAGKLDWRTMTPIEYQLKDALAIQDLHQKGSFTPFEKEYIRKDGSRVPVLIGAALLEGTQDTSICFVMDLTERKRAEEALQETNQTLQALIQACPLAITGFNFEGIVKLWNPAAEKIFGWSEQEAVGRFIPSVPESKQDEFKQNLQTISFNQPIISSETRRQRKDGSLIDVAVWAAPLPNAKSTVNCMSIIADITERKQLEAERAQLLVREQAARTEAEAANRTKDEFLATLSHELRTPLNAMLGWTQLLRTRKFDEATAARALDTIDRNTKSLAQLIEDVLDVSRIITGKLRLKVHPVALTSVIEAAIDTVKPAAEAKDIQIAATIHASVGKVLGDPNRLQQIIWNLLSNAVKFTPKGGRVEVQLSQEFLPQPDATPLVQIRVTDTGKGIPANFLPYVFERFLQADNSITRSYGGLGLGLAIVRHLVELHGGTVKAESPGEGQGATFIVQLPLLEGDRDPDLLTEKPGNVSIGESASSLDGSSGMLLQGVRVLVVDDEADARELLTTLLGQYGAEVIAVTSASEALEALHRLKPNVLVSDIGMPEEDGYTLIRQIRMLKAEQGGRIPAVALTAYARTEDRTQALLAGFQLHVPKPVNPDELAVVVANLAGRIQPS